MCWRGKIVTSSSFAESGSKKSIIGIDGNLYEAYPGSGLTVTDTCVNNKGQSFSSVIADIPNKIIQVY